MKSNQQHTRRIPVNVGKTERYVCETMRNAFVFIAFSVDKQRAYKETMATKINKNISNHAKRKHVVGSLWRLDPHDL
jgi:hypothetical protein